MSCFRCIYCGTTFPVQDLPCECPGCERTLRVSSVPGVDFPDRSVEEIMLLEDRRFLDLVDEIVNATLNGVADMATAPTYEIIGKDEAVKCLVCGLTSYNPNDVMQRYCGKCHKYHSDMQLERRLAALEDNDGG